MSELKKMVTVEDYLKSPKWVKRISGAFDIMVDKDNKGYVTEDDFLGSINELAKVVTDRPQLIAKARESKVEFTKILGITGSMKADKQKFVELMAAYAALERARLEKGELTHLEESNDAMLDVIVRRQDGMITWEEYKTYMNALNMGEESAKAVFALLDKDNSGKIKRSDYHKYNSNFWFDLDDPDVQGLFGDRFE